MCHQELWISRQWILVLPEEQTDEEDGSTHHMWTSACHRGAALNCPSLVLPQSCGSCWGLVGLLHLFFWSSDTLSESTNVLLQILFLVSCDKQTARINQSTLVCADADTPKHWGLSKVECH